ncbi:MAG: hypothetical protein PUP93_15040 [Rhizonema sp. NSF051]|nr:hypothetical protein [Rhizonema sp. NSF051]
MTPYRRIVFYFAIALVVDGLLLERVVQQLGKIGRLFGVRACGLRLFTLPTPSLYGPYQAPPNKGAAFPSCVTYPPERIRW